MKRLFRMLTLLLCFGLLVWPNALAAGEPGQDRAERGSMAPIASADGSFVITEDGVLWACGNGQWGTNRGAYGSPEEALSFAAPNKIMEGAVYVTAGQFAAMAIDQRGVLWGWGSDLRGQLLGHEASGLAQLMDDVIMASVGNAHAVALTKDGTVWTWGRNGAGQFATGAFDDGRSNHRQQITMRDVRYVTASGDATYAIKTDGSLWAWGGHIPVEGVPNPAVVPFKLLEDAAAVSPSDNALLVLKSNGAFGTVESMATDAQTVGGVVPYLDDVVFCTSGAAIQADGSLWLWDVRSDIQESMRKAMDDVLYVAVGIDETVALTDFGELWAAPVGVLNNSETEEFQLVMEHVLLPRTAHEIRSIPYQDVTVWDWFYQYAKVCYEDRLLIGVDDDVFLPYGTLTEQEAVTIAVCLHQAAYGTSEVASNEADWFEPYLDYAMKHQILRPEEVLSAEQKATRGRFMELLGRALPENQLTPVAARPIDIPDVDETTELGKGILRFYEAGILTGTDDLGNFRQGESVTRAEVAAIVSRITRANLRVA